MTELENRIQHIEDIEDIRRLKRYYYCHCVDRAVVGEQGAIEETVSRFAEGMVIDFTGLPVLEGKEAIAAFYKDNVPTFMNWCHHRVMNDVIDIEGDFATATWYFECPGDFREGNPFGILGSCVVAGRYKEEYIREGGVWMWRKITAKLDAIRALASDFELIAT